MISPWYLLTGAAASLYASISFMADLPGTIEAMGWATGILIAATLTRFTEQKIKKLRG